MMAQADDLDFSDPFGKLEVHDLRKPGFEVRAFFRPVLSVS